jgi:very-short-patch-repair endonuclease
LPESRTRFSITRNQTVSARKLALAKSLRHRMTEPERKLWKALRGNRLGGLHFRRQQVIGDFIVDFYCESIRLVIELDAPSHALRSRSDAARDAFLKRSGIAVLRVPNDAVLRNFSALVEWISAKAEMRSTRWN